MGYTSVTLRSTKQFNYGNVEITEASDLKYWDMPLLKAGRCFEFVEYCDNGKIYLKNHDGSFICLEKKTN